MTSRANICVWLVLGACGEVKAPVTKDASALDTSTNDGPVDARAADAAVDGPSFANGMLSFEEFAQPSSSVTIPYTFPNGVKLTRPTSGGTVTATNCTTDSGFFGFGCATQKQYIPEGLVFIGMPNLGLNGTVIEFEFPADIVQFSAAITNSGGQTAQTYTLTGLDSSANVKASSSVTTVAISGWDANRGALSATAGFRRVTISGNGSNAIVIDEVRWVVP